MLGKMYWELDIGIIDLDVNGKIHSGILSRANWWTGIKGWKIEVTSSIRPRLSRNNDRRQQNLYFLACDCILFLSNSHLVLNYHTLYMYALPCKASNVTHTIPVIFLANSE